MISPNGARSWKLSIYYEATESDAERFYDLITDSAAEVLGCTDEKTHVCPHFRLAGQRPTQSSRRRAVRWTLADLWRALRYGEIA